MELVVIYLLSLMVLLVLVIFLITRLSNKIVKSLSLEGKRIENRIKYNKFKSEKLDLGQIQ